MLARPFLLSSPCLVPSAWACCVELSCGPWRWAGRPGRRADGGSVSWLLLLGWSRECLQDWGPFFRLAVPSMLMLCVEWWAYEIGSFLVGTWGGGVRGDPPLDRWFTHPAGLPARL